jgi:DNA helicase-4
MWLEIGAFIIFMVILWYFVYRVSIWLKYSESAVVANNEFMTLFESDKYFSKRELKKWLDKWSFLKTKYEHQLYLGYIFKDTGKKINYLLNVFKNPEKTVSERNEIFIKKEIVVYNNLFDSIENGLNLDQKRAAIVDEANNLIIAGAGTGKTSTLLAKAAYIVKKGLATPEEVLILSFNRDVRLEIEERLKDKTGLKFPVSTFHAMGLHVIANIEPKEPAVSELSTDRLKLPKWVEKQIVNKSGLAQGSKLDDFIEKPSEIPSLKNAYREKVMDFLAFNYHPYKSEFDFKTLGDYYKYLKEFEIRSLNGDLVKSYEESEIANFLFLNDISYEYEPDYKFDEGHRQYLPDFYLPKYDLYIEHFGINREFKTAPYIDTEKYLEQMEWKRDLHQTRGTKLIETYSYQKAEGILLKELEDNLRGQGVELNPIPPERIFDKINEEGLLDPFAILISKFLNLYKAGNHNYENLKTNAEKKPNSARYISFLEVFQPIYEEYEKYLTNQRRIDFDDMINKATKYIEDGRYQSKFKYILVDEFQDISQSRYRFFKSLLRNNETNSFCVGDDWQAIYRFTGGEVSLMTKFKDYFEPCEYLYLNETFRFDNKLCDLSSRFVMKNKDQLTKSIMSSRKMDTPAITIAWVGKENLTSAIEACLKDIEAKEALLNHDKKKKLRVYIIGRYRNIHSQSEYSEIRDKFPKFDIEYFTAHKSKGVEADYVIVLNLIAGKYGFPCLIEDDPILSLVLAEKDSFPNAEERRLFYVAITRAKKHVYLLSEDRRPSSFIDELINERYDIYFQGNSKKGPVYCPVCETGQIVKIDRDYSTHYVCNNHPYCTHREKTCPSCKNGFLILNEGKYKCSNEKCEFIAKKCQLCDGYLILRNWTPAFWGCSNYFTTKCPYTEEVITKTY